MDIKSTYLASVPMLTAYVFTSANSITLLMGMYYKEEVQEEGANNLCNCAYLSCLVMLEFLIPLGNSVAGILKCTGYPINVIIKIALYIKAKGCLKHC